MYIDIYIYIYIYMLSCERERQKETPKETLRYKKETLKVVNDIGERDKK